MKALQSGIAFLATALLAASALVATAEEPQSDEAKPDEAKADEAKPDEAKPDETKAQDTESGKKKTMPEGCIFSSNINDWTVLDKQRMIVYAPSRRTPYLVELTRPASSLEFEVQLGFEDRNRDGRLCSYGGDSIVVTGTLRDSIQIRSIQRLTPDEAKQKIVEAKEAKQAAAAKAKLPPPEDMKSDKKPPDKPQ